jgi:hypothetical protein
MTTRTVHACGYLHKSVHRRYDCAALIYLPTYYLDIHTYIYIYIIININIYIL